MCLLLAMVLTMLPVQAFAAEGDIIASGECGDEGDNVTWTLYEDGTLVISGSGDMEDYYYPWYYEYRDSIVSIEIQGGVASIGAGAFSGCDNLTSVSIANSVTTIGYEAFYSCDSLTSVVIPDSVTRIDDDAFHGCNGLTSVTIGNGVTRIGYQAFSFCSSLTSVVIPDNVTYIDEYAFDYCQSLTSVSIGSGVTYIGEFAFDGCDNLTGIYVDPRNPSYSNDTQGVLFDKQKTTMIQVPGGISGHYTIPDGVTFIGDSAFSGIDGLTSVTIADSVTSIGAFAFSYCNGLTAITIPDSVITIDENAFYNCDALTSVTMGCGLESIGWYAFDSCDGLTSITLGDGVTSVGDWAFAYCKNLTSVYVPVSVTSFATCVFYGSANLTDIYYAGTEAQWNEIFIDEYNEELTSATIHFLGCAEHNYESQVVEATCLEAGYTTYTCANCGDSYVDSYTDALDHEMSQWEPVDDGAERSDCARCDYYETREAQTPEQSGSVNADTGTEYATLTEALTAARSGETVQLLADCTEANVLITPGITLDLNGCELTADYLVTFGDANVIDSVGTARLVTDMEGLVLSESNSMVPVYDGEGYIFTKSGFSIRQAATDAEGAFKLNAVAYPVNMDVVELLKEGASDNNLEVMIRLNWDTADGTGSQDFVFTDEVVSQVYSSNNGTWSGYTKMFSMTITGFENIENLKARIALVSGTNVEYMSSVAVNIT